MITARVILIGEERKRLRDIKLDTTNKDRAIVMAKKKVKQRGYRARSVNYTGDREILIYVDKPLEYKPPQKGKPVRRGGPLGKDKTNREIKSEKLLRNKSPNRKKSPKV